MSASDDNYPYHFGLGAYYGTDYSSYQYRQTESQSNPWKVDLTYNSEGIGTVATFWLDKSGTRVSSKEPTTQGAGAQYYTSAFKVANRSDVRLSAENNNYTSVGITVSGYWDEETW